MNFRGEKPIVRYSNDSQYGPATVILGDSADVYALDHPRLGKQWVFTSKVLELFHANGKLVAFETKNTLYVLDSYKIPE